MKKEKIYIVYTENKRVIIATFSLKDAKELKKNVVNSLNKEQRNCVSRIIKIKKVEFEL